MHHSFQPPIRTLMGPGPSDIHPRVLQAMARPTIGHLDPQFIILMDEIKILLRSAFKTKNELTFPVSAPGSAGMEMCFVNLVEPGDKILICQNGVFGKRMEENVIRCRGQAIVTNDDWGRGVDPQKVEDALKQNRDIKIVAFVHAETSTGASSNAALISSIAKKYDALTIVDAVTSLGGSELRVDDWGLDAVYSGSQKCLSAPPGISPVTFSSRAIAKIQARREPVQSWFLDLNLILGYWSGEGKRSYHHTAPVNAMYAMHESLVLLYEEGLENAWNRHISVHQLLKNGLESLGLKFIVPEDERLVQLNAVSIPKGVDEADVRTKLLNHYGLEIGAGLGPLAGKIWRIGLMGQSCSKKNALLCINALKEFI